jgi:hydroxymethylglutaryl-CoA lyase
MTARPVRIIEVGPRDGLQNEPGVIPTERKIAFVNALSRTGVTEIEAGSFVSPKAVPQLADSDEVFRKIERMPGVIYSALVPNEHGLERARTVAAQKIAVFTAASETFTQRNIHATVRESIERFKPVVSGAKRDGIAVRGYISTVVFCPYEGRIEPMRVAEVMKRLLALGIAGRYDRQGLAVGYPEVVGHSVAPHCSRTHIAALPRYLWHGHRQCSDGMVGLWDRVLRQFGRRAGRLSLCPGSLRECSDGRPRLRTQSVRRHCASR